MIHYVNGRLDFIDKDYIVVDVNGIGYKVYIPISEIEKLPQINNNVKVYTYLVFKEEITKLYGFLNMKSLNMFEQLITVSGIGPKGALSILSQLTPEQIILAVVTNDANSFSKCQGVGKKTAQRIILELNDKFKTLQTSITNDEDVLEVKGSDFKEEAIIALVTLGYSKSEAIQAVKSVIKENMKIEDIIKEALKKLYN